MDAEATRTEQLDRRGPLMAVTGPIRVVRLGFSGIEIGPDGTPYDGCERTLHAALREIEANGLAVVSVSVLRSERGSERYEAFVVLREREGTGG